MRRASFECCNFACRKHLQLHISYYYRQLWPGIAVEMIKVSFHVTSFDIEARSADSCFNYISHQTVDVFLFILKYLKLFVYLEISALLLPPIGLPSSAGSTWRYTLCSLHFWWQLVEDSYFLLHKSSLTPFTLFQSFNHSPLNFRFRLCS